MASCVPALALTDISIHAPPRGATIPTRAFLKLLLNFNSRPSARGDVVREAMDYVEYLFQFTPLREGRRPRPDNQFFFIDFNSRPSARGDWRGSKKDVVAISISIHAPPRGATSRQKSATV